MKIVVYLAIVLLTSTNFVYANGFSRVSYGNQKVQQVVVKQKVVDLNFPVGVNTILVPASSLGAQYYYSIGNSQISAEAADVIATKLFNKLYPNGVVPPNPCPDPVNPPKPEPKPDPSPQPVPSDLDGKVTAIFLKNCASCHSGDGAKGGLKLLDAGQLASLGDDPNVTEIIKWRIFDRTDGSGLSKDSIMPKGGKPLSDDDVMTLRQWARSSN